MAWPNNQEVAKLTVNGLDYIDWDSVQVRHDKRKPTGSPAASPARKRISYSADWAARAAICSATPLGCPIGENPVAV